MSWFRLPLFAVIAFLLCLALSAAIAFRNEVESGDDYIDDVLKDLMKEHGHEYDPYVLDDSEVVFRRKILGTTIVGKCKLHDGYMTGLRSLHRADHCSVEDKNGKLYVSADLGAGVLTLHYAGTVMILGISRSITLQCELGYLETNMEFTVDSKTGRNGELKNFVIIDMKRLVLRISGLGPIEWAVSSLLKSSSIVFKRYLKEIVENKIRKDLADLLPQYQFPVEEGGIV